ncbi:hypothetical protein ACTI_49510 [Actinoplanes sp. OR16]|uniref:endo alpha-1,4 polygalactosaminidase n=1 Tax=Actinoplanes sp. OR16 TaxID=946334 RepID=UPI000F6FD8D0|nr:endo alpha-1,4 polygalactosaminidase [Actinoplanes sp. OR16]BBH68266.1 hypothetical protein ACTI_49510 [Actinoplanes sp. OR16]
MTPQFARAALVLFAVVAIGACGQQSPPAGPAWKPLPTGARFDYQLGGAYPPPAGVTVVSRDREAAPAAGIYNICYINAFQAQPGTESWWLANHPDLLLRDPGGNLVIDEDWDEPLLDISTPADLIAVTGAWIDECAADGFQAIESDNLDSYTRSDGLLTRQQALAYATILNDRAHAAGLATGQKNAAEVTGHDAGFDFAVAEECADFDECDVYRSAYGDDVLVIEYTRAGFTKACTGYSGRLPIVLRDRGVSTPDSDSYLYDTCPR